MSNLRFKRTVSYISLDSRIYLLLCLICKEIKLAYTVLTAEVSKLGPVTGLSNQNDTFLWSPSVCVTDNDPCVASSSFSKHTFSADSAPLNRFRRTCHPTRRRFVGSRKHHLHILSGARNRNLGTKPQFGDFFGHRINILIFCDVIP